MTKLRVSQLCLRGPSRCAAAVSCSIGRTHEGQDPTDTPGSPGSGQTHTMRLEVDYVIDLERLCSDADTLARVATPVASRRADVLRAGGWQGGYGTAEQTAERDQPARSGRLQAAGTLVLEIITVLSVVSCVRRPSSVFCVSVLGRRSVASIAAVHGRACSSPDDKSIVARKSSMRDGELETVLEHCCSLWQAAMLRECHVYKPPTAVVQSTLKWAFADLEEAAMRQTAFSLLKVSPANWQRCHAQFSFRTHECQALGLATLVGGGVYSWFDAAWDRVRVTNTRQAVEPRPGSR